MATFITGTGDIKREEFMLFANVGTSESPVWEFIGDYIESLSLSMGANVETKTDIGGTTQTKLDKYQKTSDVSPYMTRRESKLSEWLYNVVRDEKTLSDTEKEFLAVNIFVGADGAFDAWIQTAVVQVTEYGGDTKGLQIPFTLHFTGIKKFGTVAITDRVPVFTAA